ncbi:MAG: hypothetical protein KKF39_00965, partial [Nanoarchaeota archaeon]|nr:hypothetical protein [Nanoarchaeota archaeon]
PVMIGDGTFVGDFVTIGYTYSGEVDRFMQQGTRDLSRLDWLVEKPTVVGARSRIGRGSIISAGSRLGEGFDGEFDIFIGSDTAIGENVRLLYRAQVYDSVRVGDGCVVGGFVGDNSQLGRNVRMLGSIIHKHKVPIIDRPGWDDISEPGPIIEDGAIIGYGAIVIGNRTVGRNSYVLAGAVVTKDVSSEDIVGGNPARSIKDKVELPS